MRRILAILLAVLATALIASCGGGGGGGSGTLCLAESCGQTDQSTPTGIDATGAMISLAVDNAQVSTNGTDKSVITAVVQNVSGAALPGINVVFSIPTGGGLLSAGTVATDDNGRATTTFTTETYKANRVVTIQALVSGSDAKAQTTISVSGTSLSLNGQSSTVIGQPITLSAVLIDGAEKPISGKAINLALASGSGSLSASSVSTDSQGKASFTYTPPTSGGTKAAISASTLDGTVSAAKTVDVSGSVFRFTAPAEGSNVDVNTCQQLDIYLEGSNDSISVTSSLGSLYPSGAACGASSNPQQTLTGVGIVGNKASVWLKGARAGGAIVTARGTGAIGSTALSLQLVSRLPDTLTLSASPTTVSAGSKSTITAYVKDNSGNPVYGQDVYFSISGAGSIDAVATTNYNGAASATFTAGQALTGLNGIDVTAKIDSTGIQGTTRLTIAGQGVTVDVGFDNVLAEIAPFYRKKFVVTVLDSNRSPIANQDVTMNLSVLSYGLGYYEVIEGATPPWQQKFLTACSNEDTNGNGLLDPGETDVNNNHRPDPITGAIVKSSDETVSGSQFTIKTDPGGKAIVLLEYPQNQAGWVQVKLTATASVQGTNSQSSVSQWLEVLASDLGDKAVTPPNRNSPYGTSGTCANPVGAY